MKKGLIFFIIFLTWICNVQSQNLLRGKPITEIFADFHYYPDKDSSTTTGFGLNRAFLGWNFITESRFSGSVIINVGNPDELATGSKSRRLAHFREASISWTGNKLILSFGMTQTRGLPFQQKFMGKRYICENFEALDGYISVSDLGFSADYTINEFLRADFTLMNGEGFSDLHIDNSLRTSLGFTVTPFKNAAIRLYGDLDHPAGVWQNMLICFVGYKNEIINIGAEVARKTNIDKINGHDVWGFSSTGSIKILDKTELFGRYDYTASSIESTIDMPWNYRSDRHLVITGIQYTFNNAFRLALDYQGMFPWSNEKEDKNGIFLNAHFRLPD